MEIEKVGINDSNIRRAVPQQNASHGVETRIAVKNAAMENQLVSIRNLGQPVHNFAVSRGTSELDTNEADVISAPLRQRSIGDLRQIIGWRGTRIWRPRWEGSQSDGARSNARALGWQRGIRDIGAP
jgi:hypothetical protein